jgi:DNA-binding transcriptional ArsR family regulator
MDERFRENADLLRAMAHPVRLGIVQILSSGEAHVTALAGALGIPQPIVSQQLRILRMHRLVAARREGGFTRYRLEEPGLRDLVSCIRRRNLALAGGGRQKGRPNR